MSRLGDRDLVRRRFVAGTFTAGRHTGGSSTDTTFTGSLQPLSGRDREVLPEGTRITDSRKIYVDPGTLRTDNQYTGDAADHVIIDGDAFVVVHVDEPHPLILHDRVYIERVQE